MTNHNNMSDTDPHDRRPEVRELRATLDTLVQSAKTILRAQAKTPLLWKRLSKSISRAENVLDAAEDGGHE